ncbi:hypothetical protein E2986_11405 [Frieseomelitta varia]|uniref:Uncharacterized protein n=1 Tax=Frieseomelitta varia TaxID=561572 RepID=A0A833SCA7_9HYME|nr:hypothetical protein E2986_11405 [Frieseomelitta varia]
MSDTKREKSGMLKLNNDESKRSITELFPWILEFRKMCRSIHTWKNMSSLTELMQFYVSFSLPVTSFLGTGLKIKTEKKPICFLY